MNRVCVIGAGPSGITAIKNLLDQGLRLGHNIGAKLQIDQAAADLKIANAKAEERRVIAVANEQEMNAKIEYAKALVIQAEAEIPVALSEALVLGQLEVRES